jgi:hypothetical protein
VNPSAVVVARRYAKRRGKATAAERAAVNAFLFGFITREQLVAKIGRGRADELAPGNK